MLAFPWLRSQLGELQAYKCTRSAVSWGNLPLRSLYRLASWASTCWCGKWRRISCILHTGSQGSKFHLRSLVGSCSSLVFRRKLSRRFLSSLKLRNRVRLLPGRDHTWFSGKAHPWTEILFLALRKSSEPYQKANSCLTALNSAQSHIWPRCYLVRLNFPWVGCPL